MADETVILLTAKRATLLVVRLVMRPHTVEMGEVHTR